MRTRNLQLVMALALAGVTRAEAQSIRAPDTVIVKSGALSLRALLWRPRGPGPFPAVLFNHGSGPGNVGPSGEILHTMEELAETLGPVFVRHGYVFLFPLRRGTGLSASQGKNSSDSWDSAMKAGGQDAKNRLQLELMQTGELNDARAGLAVLRALPGVDARRIAIAGHSFGGSLTLLMVARDSAIRAAVVFSGSARSWPVSPPLRATLRDAVAHSAVPTLLLFAANDYSVAPGEVLAADMAKLAKAHALKIYPAVGRTPNEGHNFIQLRVPMWESDVFAFLDPRMR